MGNVKYIVVDLMNDMGFKHLTILIFPNFITHQEFARRIKRPNDKILSAGFVNLGNRSCYGASTSLKLKCDYEVDNMLLKLLFE